MNRIRTGLTAGVLVLSVTAAIKMLSVDATLLRTAQLQGSQESRIPRYGSLTGYNALDNSEWSSAMSAAEEQHVVLFVVRQATAAADVEFWRDVAFMSQELMADLQFVGVCDKGNGCRVPAAPYIPVTILSAMDPYQMHALATAKRQGLALLYRGSVLAATLSVTKDHRGLAEQIAHVAKQGKRDEE